MGEGCYVHPKEEYVGVCPHCLNERLLILAANPKQYYSKYSKNICHSHYSFTTTTTSFSSFYSLSKIFALGSLRPRRKSDHYNHDDDDHFVDFPDHPSSTSTTFDEEESFISIKFGEDGEVSWDQSTNNVTKVSLEHCNMSWPSQALVNLNNGVQKGYDENKNDVDTESKPWAPWLRWRNRIGHVLEAMKWRRSTKAKGGGKQGKGIVMVN